MTFQFESLIDFLMMRGHGPYVWAAYIITLTGMIYLCVAPLKATSDMVKIERKKQSREEHASN